jgi:hypothetical protein
MEGFSIARIRKRREKKGLDIERREECIEADEREVFFQTGKIGGRP